MLKNCGWRTQISFISYSSSDLMLWEIFLFSKSFCIKWKLQIMTVIWEKNALRQDSLQMFRWASHLVSFQSPPPVPHWWFSCSISLPFGTLLEKISSSRPFLYSLKSRENNTVILGDLFQKYFIITLVLSTSSTTSPSLSSLLLSLLPYHFGYSLMWFLFLTLQEFQSHFILLLSIILEKQSLR